MPLMNRDVSVGGRGDPLFGERRPKRVPADPFAPVALTGRHTHAGVQVESLLC